MISVFRTLKEYHSFIVNHKQIISNMKDLAVGNGPAGYVALSPGSQQSGSINVSGNIQTNGSVFIGSNTSIGPTSASINGPIAATQFNGSGAGLTAGTVPNAALVTTPVTSVSATGNLSSSGGTTPTVTVTNAPTFTGVVGINGGSIGSNIRGASTWLIQPPAGNQLMLEATASTGVVYINYGSGSTGAQPASGLEIFDGGTTNYASYGPANVKIPGNLVAGGSLSSGTTTAGQVYLTSLANRGLTWDGTQYNLIGAGDLALASGKYSTATSGLILTNTAAAAGSGFYLDSSNNLALRANGTIYFQGAGGTGYVTAVGGSLSLNNITPNQLTTAIGIGTDGGSNGLFILGSTSGAYYFKNQNSVTYAPMYGGLYTNASDITWKKNIKPIPYGIREVLQMKPSEFNWRSDERYDLGFIAQQMKKVIPKIVVTDKKGKEGFAYTAITAVLVKAIQELTEKISNLEKKIEL